MSLLVPALRVVMAFTNVWETYKTLKMPPPSPRNGGRPTIRALSQRKRDMKGCLAVWLVFCCFTLYERFAEKIISIFIPFYDELKSMVMVFLIVARSRAAEPIYLHIIRPFLKPHTVALDAILEVATMIGDLIFTVATLPLQPFIMWWQARQAETEYPYDPTQDGTATPKSTSVVSETVSAASVIRESADAVEISSSISVQQIRVANAIEGLPATPTHQIWHPPASAYKDEQPEERFIPPHPDELDKEVAEAGATLASEDEWRKYPDFPSAYPATPAAATLHLKPESKINGGHPSLNGLDGHDRFNMPSSIPEDDSDYDDQPGFRQSLRTPREDQDPHSVPVLSDESIYLGIHATRPVGAEPAPMVVDEDGGERKGARMYVDGEDDGDETYDEDEEDSFNITLRTPMPRGGLSREVEMGEAPPLPALRVEPVLRGLQVPSVARSTAKSVPSAAPVVRDDKDTVMAPPTVDIKSSTAATSMTNEPSPQGPARPSARPDLPFRATKIAGKKRAHEQAEETELSKVPVRTGRVGTATRPTAAAGTRAAAGARMVTAARPTAARGGRSGAATRSAAATRVRRTASAETNASVASTSTATTARTASTTTLAASEAGTDLTVPSDDEEQHAKRRRVLSTQSGKSVAVPVVHLKKASTARKAPAAKREVPTTRPATNTRTRSQATKAE
ncbi:hypothetical protein K525DRAFT_256499 [Schizophyllum commune Loenen D]|nr:hypothetical protein K525DRAFT_256499 [Schizophyllum commune Loenen D]